ncbi:MAG: helix-turn-helix domain-containing protein [Verrucomicrobia bacterium]|nr:helix-turn-helix domain-containing protein [Verrucomicrobiota bacterium]
MRAKSVPSSVTTLSQLRAVIENVPPIGAELAQACHYDSVALAHYLGCSPRQLQRVFAKFGLSPGRWLFVHRLLVELRQLEHLYDSGKFESIKRTAIELGYRQPEHFNRNFKKVFGISPKTFLAERESIMKRLGMAPPPR